MDLTGILEKHHKWLTGEVGGERANLERAYLRSANLRSANLEGANLYGANLEGANLEGANLRSADLYGANLRSANLEGANLRSADLYGANLRSAYLYGANLEGANLEGANLEGSKMPHYQIVPEEGAFIGWKKAEGCVIRLLIPAKAKRTSCFKSRKNRAEFVKVLSIKRLDGELLDEIPSSRGGLVYKVGEYAHPDSFNDDPREECTNGIHFFVTEREAIEW